MKKIKGAFKLYEGNINFSWISKYSYSIFFNIKLGGNFRQKARIFVDGNRAEPPSQVAYSCTVSRDSVKICLIISALNDLDIQASNIENRYITATCRENLENILGKESGYNQGKPLKIARELYGLKSFGAAFRAHLDEKLDQLCFKQSTVDTDVWMRAALKPDDEKYY